MKKLITPLWFIIIAVLLGLSKEALAANNDAKNDPAKAIADVVQVMKSAQQDQADVLASEEFVKGRVFLEDARLGIKEEYLVETIMESAAMAKATFLNALEKAKTRKSKAGRILKDRKAALLAGVRKSNTLVKQMMEIDEELIDETDEFSESLDPDDFSEIQKKYYRLETRAIQFNALNSAKQAIDQATEDDADDVAPKTLRAALLDYKTAMNRIDLSPRNPNVYKESVDNALVSATHLFDVMNVIKGAEGTPEQIAIQIVKQKRALGKLSSSVGKLEANLKSTKQTLQEKEGALKQVDTVLQQKDTALKEKDTALKQTKTALKQKEGVLRTQEEQLARASTQVRFQQAMDEARKVIPETDALVYQQGNKLVFRLKRINFRSGAATIPEFSKLLISKVNSIIKKLDAKKVIVQGHTDSVGSAKVNKRLSTKRATAVATYLHQLRGGYKITYAGYGESYPIAPNETADGRATNRRVDLVVSVKQ
ncbi:hypothetical protein MNBD_GAMMA23-789 [hydrothermal vent metagenome]|uniref:OmpA-like domain-containing protein n=1 Tax=hydrothermal vent metagenome TaxID=652676 RepID=A0A3B1AEF8_9ZZZZ